ncbi:NADH--cytochrome b5 reductase 1 [Morella rubra]|uniref:cytochrome-b5 reductase n=1 Tax=Morella rubra TaxID=262757 RepID=A0A6A1UQM8_9ROSI|nr:NADH--cytochrome b5 reductase 1 [Morella rubra]
MTFGFLCVELKGINIAFPINWDWDSDLRKFPLQLVIGCLDPENFKEFKLVKRTQLSHNVAKFRFALPTPTSVLGLPIGQHMSCRGKDALGEEVIKAYTPTTLDSDVGYFELVIKMYPQGRMSHHFREMREGDYLAVKGPKGRFKYQPNQVRAFGMLAGGTGITPMFQEELDNIARNFPNRFSVHYVLNQVVNESNSFLCKTRFEGCIVCEFTSLIELEFLRLAQNGLTFDWRKKFIGKEFRDAFHLENQASEDEALLGEQAKTKALSTKVMTFPLLGRSMISRTSSG